MNIHPETLINIRSKAWIYWKDTESNYLGCNDLMAQDLNLLSRKDIVGRNDFNIGLVNSEESKFFRDCDRNVMQNSITLQFKDSATLPNKKINFIVLKTPIFNEKKLIGVMGISFYDQINLQHNFNLSKRQLDVVYYLLMGKTQKEIAYALGLSPKTIEHYIDTIKSKLNCDTRSELVTKLLEIGF